MKKLRRTCWRIRMKRQPAPCAEPSDSSFPLFSQKGAGDSALQVQAEKRVVVVSTHSQISSQQQGFIYLAFRQNFLQKRLVVVQIRAKWDGFVPSQDQVTPLFYVVVSSWPYAHELRCHGTQVGWRRHMPATQTATEFLAGVFEAR